MMPSRTTQAKAQRDRWMRENAHRFPGRWVSVDECGTLIAVGNSPAECEAIVAGEEVNHHDDGSPILVSTFLVTGP